MKVSERGGLRGKDGGDGPQTHANLRFFPLPLPALPPFPLTIKPALGGGAKQATPHARTPGYRVQGLQGLGAKALPKAQGTISSE